MRLFVAIDPGPAVRERIERAVEAIRPLAPGSKWVDVSHGHITLVFLGNIEDTAVPEVARAIEEVAGRHAPVALRFSGGGAFGSPKRPRVLWAGVEGDVAALAAIQKDVEAAVAAFGVAPEDRAFNPHMTLARGRAPGGDAGLAAARDALAGRDFGEARIDEIILFRSDLTPKGPRYTAVVRAHLRPAEIPHPGGG